MILNLRSTSGGGKTTVVRAVMAKWPKVATRIKSNGTPLVYRVTPPGRALYVFGSYENACGGVDTIRDYKTIVPALLREYAPQGDILYEGMLISGTYGSIGPVLKELEAAGHRVVIGFMDTPIELCLERVATRRRARGDARPLDPKNTVNKHNAVLNARKRISGLGHTCITIEHVSATEQVLGLLGLSGLAIHTSAAEGLAHGSEQGDLFA